MTRPGMVRADTLDLQDPDSPSAQDHSKQVTTDLEFGDHLIGIHHAQEIRHINHERHEEEKNLQQAWDAATGDLDAGHLHNNNDEQDNDGDVDGTADDDMMDRISSSPSIDDEDIDFDSVYALHTFVATVDGQANATKGDTMVLLDDSNSYWWLVRIVKDSSIGYLPAEHIETPTERLARLNKHRNVDLSAAMLGDAAQPKKMQRKGVMRRRTKNVTFGEPSSNIYFEASDYEPSSDDEDGQVLHSAENEAGNDNEISAAAESDNEANTERSSTDDQSAVDRKTPDLDISTDTANARNGSINGSQIVDSPPISPRLQEKAEGAPLRSRHGTPRNAESLIRDESAETTKFTLTPNILRDGNDGANRSGSEPTITRVDSGDLSTPEKEPIKDVKSKKEKKQRTFSGLFKSKKKDKEKERKVSLADSEPRVSNDTQRSSTSIASADASPKQREVERKTSQKGRRLQKNQAAPPAPVLTPKAGETPMTEQTQTVAYPEDYAELDGSEIMIDKADSPPRQVETRDTFTAHEAGDNNEQALTSNGDHASAPAALKETSANHEYAGAPATQSGGYAARASSPYRDAYDDKTNGQTFALAEQYNRTEERHTDAPKPAVSLSPVSPLDSAASTRYEPALTIPTDTSADARGDTMNGGRSAHTPSPAPPTPAPWSDAKLLAWAEGDNDIRDMLTIIYDPTEAKPDPNHPLVKDMFKEEQARLDAMSKELDNLLGGYMKRLSARGVEASG